MSRSDNDMDNTTTTKVLFDFTKNILNSDKSIRWVAITDQDGIILNEQNREEGFKSLLTKEENQESAVNTIIRQKTRTKFEPKIGKLSYALGRYQKLSRCLIPINENYYLILTIDFEETNFDKIIIEKIVPLIKKEKFFIR
jgi:muramidase (phage lysozyme)